ncbi:TEK-like protein [Chrysosporum bergii ANA360D]|uniref:TEK-like protein n=1 Tax=Chrysosporum bergii ANA360D TaxID=617107 RepID=A0AA43KAZ8_9CYAN|nr:TEK-like protein [Chrysosporum bergii]MDH6059787.1 TEK-like protein [Chrysosporum bergii ANA360D]
MNTNAKKISKAAAIASLLAGGAVAGSFVAGQPAQAQIANSASVAVTNILTNGNTVTFAGEMVMPEDSGVTLTGGMSLGLTYTANGGGDNYLLQSASFNISTKVTAVQSVAASTARAIDSALVGSRFGDIIGVLEAAGME